MGVSLLSFFLSLNTLKTSLKPKSHFLKRQPVYKTHQKVLILLTGEEVAVPGPADCERLVTAGVALQLRPLPSHHPHHHRPLSQLGSDCRGLS